MWDNNSQLNSAMRGLTARKGNIMTIYPENLSSREAYNMTKSSAILKLSDAAGQIMHITAFVLREDENAKGESQEVLSVRDENGTIYATNSKPFIREFTNVLDFVNGDMSKVNHIEVVAGTSKAGRRYITMKWVD